MRRWTGPLAGALLAATQAGCLFPEASPPVAAAPPAPRTARPLERDHAALLSAFGGELRAPALQAAVEEIVPRLVARTDRPGESYAVTILDSPKVNAFALPSGRLYVTRGLMTLANEPSELAAVIAHEIAHVTRRHAAERVEREARSALLSRVVSDLLNDPAGGEALRDRSRLTLAGFSRAQELEADALGIATVAAAGYDPHAAARFLTLLERHAELERRGAPGAGEAELLASHPATAERVALAVEAARRITSPPSGRAGREAYFASLEGVSYGDRPNDGLIRGRTFTHPRLKVAFTAPEGFALENTAEAVLGATADERGRLLFDAVDVPEGQGLQELLTTSWRGAIEPGSLRTAVVNGRPAALASSRGRDWTFRLSAVRVGGTSYRLILAGRDGAADLDRRLESVLASLREVGPEEAAELRAPKIAIVTAEPGDTAETLARRMSAERPLDRFLVLNGLARGEALRPGERYKLVVD